MSKLTSVEVSYYDSVIRNRLAKNNIHRESFKAKTTVIKKNTKAHLIFPPQKIIDDPQDF